MNKFSAGVKVLVVMIALFTLSACNGEADIDYITDTDSISDITWQWESVSDKPSGEVTTVPNPGNYTLVFRKSGTFSGQADSRQIGGTHSQEGGFKLYFNPSTIAYRLFQAQNLEKIYLNLLHDVVAVGLDGAGGLVLEWAGAEKRMEFSDQGSD